MIAPASLLRLAESHGVAHAYDDFRGVARDVAPDALAAILEALGVHTADPETALLDQQRARWSQLVEPAVVAWDGRGALVVRTPTGIRNARLEIDLVDEAGVHRSLELRLSDTRVVARGDSDGVEQVSRRVPLPLLAIGYHAAYVRLRAGAASTDGAALVLAAPRRTFRPAVESRAFGVFAPLYGLHSKHSLGIGNLGDLRLLLEWTRGHGGATVGTLPLLATVHDDPEGVSPYAPITRLAWDELFLDLLALPEFGASNSARSALAGARDAIDELRERASVDYQGVERVLWPVLSELARQAFEAGSGRREAIVGFAAERPLVRDYARFRGARAHLGASWREWPSLQRGGALGAEDPDETAYRTHLYAQFALHEQLTALAAGARRDGGLGLYLDLPLGAHRLGFDAWRFPEAFADDLDVGAPPDAISTAGQNWHFAPAQPEGLRRSGYRYLIESVRNHLRYAGVLRIDHVMAMHRLFVMPRGGAASDGAYLHYRPDEHWAILSIESHRARSVVIGEDLGTVPAAVHTAMDRHGVGGSWVLQYEARRSRRALRVPSPLAVASLNTHDMPTFEGWVRGRDIEARTALGQLSSVDLPEARAGRDRLLAALPRLLGVGTREPDGEAPLRACLNYLGRSEASLVLVALDDLLAELDPQNVPGTTVEHPNWRRRLALSLEESARSPRALEFIELLRRARAGLAQSEPRTELRRPDE